MRLSFDEFCGGGDPALVNGLFTADGTDPKVVCCKFISKIVLETDYRFYITFSAKSIPFFVTFFSDSFELKGEGNELNLANSPNRGFKLQYEMSC